MSIFNELKDSLAEAVDIKHGRKVASRLADFDAAGVTVLARTLEKYWRRKNLK